MSKDLLSIDELRSYICRELLNDETILIEDNQDLLMSGLLDSLNVVLLASHIEKSANISIPPEDMIIEHFGSLSQITAYVNKHLCDN